MSNQYKKTLNRITPTVI